MKTVKFPITVTEAGVSAKIRKVKQSKNGSTYYSFVVEYWLLGRRKREWRANLETAKTAASDACLDWAKRHAIALPKITIADASEQLQLQAEADGT